ncbi:hypothetical protein Sjap_001980 [Stephania japonica]|uniref:RING-type domain-containing protein n=1 Tax=Stephania japonica TaxID=461633 RepID=A0AAP0KNK1_9MAGN
MRLHVALEYNSNNDWKDKGNNENIKDENQMLSAPSFLSLFSSFFFSVLRPKCLIGIETPMEKLKRNSEAKTGALCCVAAGPHGADSNARGRIVAPREPNWRTNSSFSPPFRGWDCRSNSDGLRPVQRASVHDPSSINREGIRNRASSDQFANHQHSVSDGVVSYFASPSNNFMPPRWTPPLQNSNSGDLSSPVGGSRPGTSLFPKSTERQFNSGTLVVSNSFSSPSSLSESSHWESTSKQPISYPHHFSSRRSFRSKPVYPLVFRNPILDGEEAFSLADRSTGGRLASGESRYLPYHSPEDDPNLDLKFHRTLMELQRIEDSLDPGLTSRREGFRWSNASSYDMGNDGENINIAADPRSLNSTLGDHKCGLCRELLWQKSPWSSYRMVRGGDMPVAGVLSCSHVFHAECLEQVTPKAESCDPPCPLCLKLAGVRGESPASESLQMALRAVRRNQGVVIMDAAFESNVSDHSSNLVESTFKRKQSSPAVTRGTRSSSAIKSHLKKHFAFRGKAGKDFFHNKVFRSFGSSSSSHETIFS